MQYSVKTRDWTSIQTHTHTLKLTVYKRDICSHQLTQLKADEQTPALCLLQHHNGFTFI